MQKLLAGILAGAVILLPGGQSEAQVSPQEQTLGRTSIVRPVVESLRDEAHQAIEQDLDVLVCKLTDEVGKSKKAEGKFTYQVSSETDFYVSLLLETQMAEPQGKLKQHVYGILYEKNHGHRVRLEEMLGFKPEVKQLEELLARHGLETISGTKLAGTEQAKPKRVPEDLLITEDGKLYVVFQPGEMLPDCQEATRLLVAVS